MNLNKISTKNYELNFHTLTVQMFYMIRFTRSFLTRITIALGTSDLIGVNNNGTD